MEPAIQDRIMAPKTIESELDRSTRPGELLTRLADDVLICTACGHRCKLRPGQRGVCKVRFNENGVLRVPFNYAAGVQNDPIEKKPFFHVLPGSLAMSFGMLGCDFHCSYCQNWFTSQALRDDASTLSYSAITADEICDLAQQQGAKSVISTYNEPLITSEWAVEVFRAAKKRGLLTGYVSNGHGTEEVLKYLQPWLDLFKIDLKSFSAKNYRRLGGNLDAVLDTIRQVHAMGFWTEIVTLVVPGYNDSDAELTEMAEFIASVSVKIPWHVTGFFPTYKMTDKGPTPAESLLRARQRGLDCGLKFVYCGNRTGRVENTENTFCPKCREVVIKRQGFRVVANRLASGACSKCGEPIPGRWPA
jgi:pyruvate formate lyase activating enzyme